MCSPEHHITAGQVPRELNWLHREQGMGGKGEMLFPQKMVEDWCWWRAKHHITAGQVSREFNWLHGEQEMGGKGKRRCCFHRGLLETGAGGGQNITSQLSRSPGSWTDWDERESEGEMRCYFHWLETFTGHCLLLGIWGKMSSLWTCAHQINSGKGNAKPNIGRDLSGKNAKLSILVS
jgi:hypothetical protein